MRKFLFADRINEKIKGGLVCTAKVRKIHIYLSKKTELKLRSLNLRLWVLLIEVLYKNI